MLAFPMAKSAIIPINLIASGVLFSSRPLAYATRHRRGSAKTDLRYPALIRRLDVSMLNPLDFVLPPPIGVGPETSPESASIPSNVTHSGLGEVITHYDFSSGNHRSSRLISQRSRPWATRASRPTWTYPKGRGASSPPLTSPSKGLSPWITSKITGAITLLFNINSK